MLYIGADPDLHDCPIAVVNDEGRVVRLWVCRAANNKGAAAVICMLRSINHTNYQDFGLGNNAVVAVEGQEIYRGAGADADTKNPRDLINLAAVAGGLLLYFDSLCTVHRSYYPKPAEWKKQVKKPIHQARTCSKLGWEYEQRSGYCVPFLTAEHEGIAGILNIKVSDWKHVLDAIGLALWVRDRYTEDVARERRLYELKK